MGKVILPKASYETARVAIMGIDPFLSPSLLSRGSIAFRTLLLDTAMNF